jgi:hypothetical protein
MEVQTMEFLLFCISALAVLLFVDSQHSSMKRLARARARRPEPQPGPRSGRRQ